MRQPSPGHIGDVQQTVDPAKVDKSAIVGEVLDGAGEDRALFEVLQSMRAALGLLFLEDLLAGNNDVAALLVELNDADLNRLANVGVEIAHRAQLELRAGQERLDANVYRETALHAADHGTRKRGLLVVRLLHRVPHTEPLRLFIAQQVAAFRLLALNDHIDAVAGMQLRLTGVIENLLEGNQALGLHADVDDDMLVSELDDRTGDDRGVVEGLSSSFRGLLPVKGLEGSGEVFHAQVGLVVMQFGRGIGGVHFGDARHRARPGTRLPG